MKIILVLFVALSLAACAKSPTRNTQVVDDRPGLAFELAEQSESYELKVDGVSYGRVGQYKAGENLLKIIDGTHQIELVSDGEVVYRKEVYLGAGSNRVLKVGDYE